MLLHRTEKARRELSPGVRTLSLRERSLLLLADGKPLADLQAMYHGIGAQMVEQLVREGYLTHLATTRAADTAAPAPETPPEPTEALRSLAGTRMYLFDLCERLFARRDPVLAQHFREALRAAKDRTSMLDVGEAMFEEVALAAGAERAASLRERLDQLLPTSPVAENFAATQPALLN